MNTLDYIPRKKNISYIEKAVGNGVLTITNPGIILFTMYLSTGVSLPPNILERDFLSSPGYTINGISDELWICARPLTGNVGIFGSIVYKEF